MKYVIALIIAVAFSCGKAEAAQAPLWKHQGVICSHENGIVACIAVTAVDGDIRRYSVAISRQSVIVFDTIRKKRVFSALQERP